MRTKESVLLTLVLLIPFAVGAGTQDVDATPEPNGPVWDEEANGPLPRWRDGEYIRVAGTRDDVGSAAIGKLFLLPAGKSSNGTKRDR